MASKGALKVPVLYPTVDDMNRPFEDFIAKHEKKIGAVGLAKIVPPASWSPRPQGCRGYEDLPDVTLERCIKQVATGSKGLYRFLLVEQKPMSLNHSFKPHALHDDQQPGTSDPAEVERKYWRTVGIRPPLYGADIHGSLFDSKCKGWTLRNLDTVLSKTLAESGHDLPGVSSPYLYYGMWRSTFAWHCEDLDLYSVNYLHFGAPKHWYCIPPAHRQRFENLLKGLLPDLFGACPEFMRHKELLISPQMLDLHQIPYVKAVQHPREFMINFPGAYHAGFNAGFNCAESVNFGTRRWIPLGVRAGVCKCSEDSVKIDMRIFRHLVPSKLLPPELLVDTDEEAEAKEEAEEEEEEARGISRGPSQRRRMQTASVSGRAPRRGGAAMGRNPPSASVKDKEDNVGRRRMGSVRRVARGGGRGGPSASGRGGGRRTLPDLVPSDPARDEPREDEDEEAGGWMRSDDEEFVLDEEDVRAAEAELAVTRRGAGSRSRSKRAAEPRAGRPLKARGDGVSGPAASRGRALKVAPPPSSSARLAEKQANKRVRRPPSSQSQADDVLASEAPPGVASPLKRARRAKAVRPAEDDDEAPSSLAAPSQGRKPRTGRQPGRGGTLDEAAPSVVAPSTPVPSVGPSPSVRLPARRAASRRGGGPVFGRQSKEGLLLGTRRSSSRAAKRQPSDGQYRQFAVVGDDDDDDGDASLDDEEEDDDVIDSDGDVGRGYDDGDEEEDSEEDEEEEDEANLTDSDEDAKSSRKRGGGHGGGRMAAKASGRPERKVVSASAAAAAAGPRGATRRSVLSAGRADKGAAACSGRSARKVKLTWKVAAAYE